MSYHAEPEDALYNEKSPVLFARGFTISKTCDCICSFPKEPAT